MDRSPFNGELLDDCKEALEPIPDCRFPRLFAERGVSQSPPLLLRRPLPRPRPLRVAKSPTNNYFQTKKKEKNRQNSIEH